MNIISACKKETFGQIVLVNLLQFAKLAKMFPSKILYHKVEDANWKLYAQMHNQATCVYML